MQFGDRPQIARRRKMSEKRRLVLESGEIFEGYGFGAEGDKVLELVFNTSMVGYQEILSDPSYTDQAVVMTYPLHPQYRRSQQTAPWL